MCYGVFGGKGIVDALRGRKGRFMRLNLSSSTLYLIGVLFSILFLALFFFVMLVISVLDVILSMYTPSELLIYEISLFIEKKKKKSQLLSFWRC